MKKSSYREQRLCLRAAHAGAAHGIGLTQAGLADLLGVSRNAVGGWEIRPELSQSRASQSLHCPGSAAARLCGGQRGRGDPGALACSTSEGAAG